MMRVFHLCHRNILHSVQDYTNCCSESKEYMIEGYSSTESYNGAVGEFAVFKATLKEAENNPLLWWWVIKITIRSILE
jgi:hypothetical protein